MYAFETLSASILQDQWSNVVNPVFFLFIEIIWIQNWSIRCSSSSLASFNRPHSSESQYDKWTIFQINSAFRRYSKMLTIFDHAETTCHRYLQHFFCEVCRMYKNIIYSVFSYVWLSCYQLVLQLPSKRRTKSSQLTFHFESEKTNVSGGTAAVICSTRWKVELRKDIVQSNDAKNTIITWK